MKLPRKQAALLQEAIEQWQRDGLLAETQEAHWPARSSCSSSIGGDWRSTRSGSRFFSLVSSVSAALSDRLLTDLLEQLFEAPAAAKCAGLTLIATGCYWWGMRRRALDPTQMYRNEAILFLGVVATAGAIYQLGRALDTGSGHFSILLLLSFFVYAMVGLAVDLGVCAGLAGWVDGNGNRLHVRMGRLYPGMNFPLRFVFFGAVLTACAFALETHPKVQRLYRSTLTMGLLYLFLALWIMSILGNYGDLPSWQRARQIEIFHWSLLFGLVTCGVIYHGLKYDHGITKGFGLTFLFINLYTRYFELFWDSIHKAVFFALSGLSFWYLGTKAEKIWNVGRSPAA